MRPIITLVALGLLVTAMACSGGDKESFRNVDHDQDGKISYEELLFVFPGTTEAMFRELDTDHDGMLSENEYAQFIKNNAQRAAAKNAPQPDAAATSGPNALNQPAVPYSGEEVIEIAPPAPEAGHGGVSSAKTKPEKGKRDGKKQPNAATTGGPTQYTVQRGDNLTKIAQRFGLRVEDITQANGNMSPDTLRDGQVLNIPARP